MNKSFIGAAAVVFSVLASFSVQAETRPQADQASVAVTAPRQSYTLGAGEFSEFANAYKLSNGQVAQFTQRGNHYYVQLKGTYRELQRDERSGQHQVATRLRAVGPGAFVTDGGAELTFREQGDEVAISGFERLPDARVAANQTNVQMIARR